MELDALLQFIKLTHAFQQTKRSIYVTGEDRLEHDAEHSYQLALVAWYIAQSRKLPLDTNLIVKYALSHDLVEVYAGDTPNFGHGAEARKTKIEREEEAYKKLHAEFPSFPELFSLIEKYEAKSDPESKFVYSLDKLLSSINIYLDKGRSWFKNNVSLQEMIDSKKPRMIDKDIDDMWEEFIKKIRPDEMVLFPNK